MASLQARLVALRIRRDPLLRPERARGSRSRPGRVRAGGPSRVLGGRGQRAVGEFRTRVVARPRPREVRPSTARRRQVGLDGRELLLLAEMLTAGVRLDRALESLERAATRPERRQVLAGMRETIQAGRTFDAAIAELGVQPHLRALIAGGERIGRLGDGLRSAAELDARLAAVRRRVQQAMIYPAVVLVVALLVLVIVSVSVVPQMEQTFRDLGGELPRATRTVVAIARLVRSPGAWLAMLAVSGSVWWVLTTRAGRPRGGGALSAVRGAVSGLLQRPMDVAVAARIIATLLANGGTAVDAFATAADGAVHPLVRRQLHELAVISGSGRPIADSAVAEGLLEPVERELIAVGEERGLLAQQWVRVADRRIERLERRLDLLGTLAEPVLVVIVGLIVGGTVTALYLPSMKVLELI